MGLKRLHVIALLGILGAFAFGSVAFAASGDLIPHGGYSAATSSCPQCHTMHEAPADYVLLRWATVTDTCASCHTIYQAEPTGPYETPYPGLEYPYEDYPGGVASELRAYKVDEAVAAEHDGHRLSLGNNIIPGGTQELTAIKAYMYPETVPATDFDATDGLYCASCHTPHGTFGQMVPADVSTKLLSSKPNHIEDEVVLDGIWLDEGGLWCGACHDKRLAGIPDQEGEYHYNHPHQFCLDCHGDWLEDPPEDADFPHTGGVNLLTEYPDQLCIRCHVAGSLP